MAKTFIYSILFLIISTHSFFAQDVRFTQFMITNNALNPAFCGAFEGNFRIRSIYKSQWTNLDIKPLSTFALTGDIKLFLDHKNTNYLALGLHFLTDKAGSIDVTSNTADIQVSYHKIYNTKHRNSFSGGISLGILQKSLNYDRFVFGDQFDGLNHYNLPTSELLPPNVKAIPDLKLGLQLESRLNKKWRIQTGLAAGYLISSQTSFYSGFDEIDYTGSKDFKTPVLIHVISNFTYQKDKQQQIYPRLHFSSQGTHQLAVLGTNYRRAFYSLNQSAFHLGATMRVSKNETAYFPIDLGVMTGFEFKNFILGLSYDFGIKDVVKYGRALHGFEISFSLLGDYDNGGFICPQF